MNNYLSSASLKAQARGQLLGKYSTVIGIYLLHMLCAIPLAMTASSINGSGSVLAVLIASAVSFFIQLFIGFFTAGEAYVYLKVACNQRPAVSDLFHCFREDNVKVLQIQAVLAAISVISALPSAIVGYFMSKSFLGILLGVSSGGTTGDGADSGAALFLAYTVLYLLGTVIKIFAQLLFSQVYYLMLDFPEYSAPQLLRKSIQLMKGSMGRLFYIELSFVPLLLLGGISFGIGMLWILPYMEAVSANFYLDLIKKKQESSI